MPLIEITLLPARDERREYFWEKICTD